MNYLSINEQHANDGLDMQMVRVIMEVMLLSALINRMDRMCVYH
jgi:hypothetical protein